ncbi:hypothetical protein SAMN04487934_1191 [Eubacterium ruminantium]|nr:hypothetical protein SAMN04487934_1191 [Eubacterium ruminantium]
MEQDKNVMNSTNDTEEDGSKNGKKVRKVKKYSRGTYIIGIAVFMMIAILVFVSNFKSIFKIYDDLNKKLSQGEELEEGDYVSINLNQGYYIKAYAEADYKLYGFIPSGRMYYFLLQLKNGKYISVSAKRDIANRIESIISGQNDENLKISGSLEKLNDQVEVYYNKTISSFALNDEDSSGVYDLNIEAADNATPAMILIGVSIMLALLFALLLVRSYRK